MSTAQRGALDVVPPAAPRPRYLMVDALRGVAAMAVVLFHIQGGEHLTQVFPKLPRFVQLVLRHGNAGVSMFFVISGFAIANSLAYRHVTPGYAARFVGRRSLRLDPPYWASMVFAVVMSYLSARFVDGDTFVRPSVPDVLAHLAYLTDILGVPQISDVYWTLCLEIQFYLSFALVLVIVSRIAQRLGPHRALDVVLWPAVLFADACALDVLNIDVRGLFVNDWHLFLTGVLVWRAIVHRGDRGRAQTAAAGAQVALLAIASLGRHDIAMGVAAVTASMVLIAGLTSRLERSLSQRPLQFLGAISYSLYLTHNQIAGPLFRIGFDVTGRSAAREVLWLVIVVAASVAFAWVFWRAIERPSQRLSKGIALSGPAPSTSVR